MNYLKRILKPFITNILFIIISIFVITFLSYFNILGYKITIYLKLILSILAFIISGYMIGKTSNKNGWLEGLKYSFIIIIPVLIINLLLGTFKYKVLIFYAILSFCSIVGSMIGIARKKETS